jgi:hypothetical protein
MTRTSLLLILIITALLARVRAQYPNTPIMGWKMEGSNGHYTFTPATLFGTPIFHYDIYPPEKGSNDLDSWLSSKVEKDVQASGYILQPGQSKAQDIRAFKVYSVLVKDAAGKSWLLNYMAYLRQDHSIRFGRITEVPNAAIAKNNMNIAVQHFIRLSKQEGVPGETRWGTWKQEDSKTLVVTMNSDHKPDRWEGAAHWFWAVPAAKNEKLAGTWSTIGGGGNTAFGGGSMVVSSNVLTFNTQGQFTTLSTGGGSYNGSTGSVTAYSSKDGAGTYTFDGYSLELKYNNGKIVRKNFCFYADSKDVWVFGTRPYTPSDSNKKNK